MTAARLEELAVWAEAEAMECQYEGSMLRSAKFADLARCARGWATVEGMMMNDPGTIELFGYRARDGRWSIYPGGLYGSQRFTADTALEAVETAWVKP